MGDGDDLNDYRGGPDVVGIPFGDPPPMSKVKDTRTDHERGWDIGFARAKRDMLDRVMKLERELAQCRANREEWSFDMLAAPQDKTPVLLTVPSSVPGGEPTVGEAYFDPHVGTWWWSGTSADQYPAISINEGNEMPIAWMAMPAPAPTNPNFPKAA